MKITPHVRQRYCPSSAVGIGELSAYFVSCSIVPGQPHGRKAHLYLSGAVRPVRISGLTSSPMVYPSQSFLCFFDILPWVDVSLVSAFVRYNCPIHTRMT